ncbi:MAG: hypothetical protein NTZ18_01635 [Candidatus Komeilibacteria bacterium]|nr:hypothetical protein [Candidatus Komeilibacteria bacterium]
MKNKFLIPALFSLMVLALSGCIINLKTSNASDGGIFKSADLGDHWAQITSVYHVGDVAYSFASYDATALVMDPTDNKAIYFGTADQGLFYTYNGGTGWQQTLTGSGPINALAVSPKERCIIYAALGNRLYKTVDCSRHWSYQLIETREDPNNQINAVAVDSFNTNIVYAGTSGRGLFRSDDSGFSWHAVKFFDDRILDILINQADSRIIYAATALKGIFKTTDAGVTWQPLFSDQLIKDKENLLAYRALILDPTVPDGLLYASQYGFLMRSKDGGASWQDIKLLTPPSATLIYSLAINPKDGNNLFYGTAKALYRSVDNGANWITRVLPTARAAKFILLDPQADNTLYLGVKIVQ